MTNEIRNLIKNHLECIDLYNEMNEGKNTAGMRNLFSELMGMKMMLGAMGLTIEFDVNPYYYMNKEPSTYSVRLEA
jgi:hypothetical protein